MPLDVTMYNVPEGAETKEMGGMLYHKVGSSWVLSSKTHVTPSSWREQYGTPIEKIGYKWASGYGLGASGGRKGIPETAEDLLNWAKGINPFMPELGAMQQPTGETPQPTLDPVATVDTGTLGQTAGDVSTLEEQFTSGALTLEQVQAIIAGQQQPEGDTNGAGADGNGALGLILALALALL